MPMTETERLDYLVEHLEGGKSAAFAEKIGVRRDVRVTVPKYELISTTRGVFVPEIHKK